MKRILFCASGLGVGGVEKVLLQILKKINLKNNEIKLSLNNGNEDFFEHELPPKIDYKYMIPKSICLKTREFKNLKQKNFVYGLHYSFMLWYEKILSNTEFKKYSRGFDVIIDFKSGDNLKKIYKKKCKKIVWLHGEIDNLKKYKKNKEKFIKQLESIDKVVVISDDMKKKLLEKFPQFEKKIIRIYNPFDFQEIRNKAEDLSEENSENLELMLKKEYFCKVARLDLKSKDFVTLFKGYKEFSLENSLYELVIVGDGPDRDEIKKIIKDMQLEDKVHLIGNRKNPYPWIKNCKILIQSSFFEGLPTVLIEGLILEKNIISSDCPTGPSEILNRGEIGELFPIGDTQILLNKIKKVLSFKREELEKIRDKTEERIKEFDYKSIVKMIEEILR